MTSKRHACGWALGLLVVVGALALVALSCSARLPQPPEVRYLSMGQAGRPMFYVNQDSNATPPPRPTDFPYYGGNLPRGQECLVYLNDQMPTSTTYNWTGIDNCIAYAAQRTITLGSGTVISQPVMLVLPAEYIQSGGGGTNDDPYGDMSIAPSWLRDDVNYTVKFQNASTSAWYWGIKYHTLTTIFTNLFQAAAARYDTNPQVGLIRVNVGFEYEDQPVKSQEGAGQGINVFTAYHAAADTCDQYKTFVQQMAEAADSAFTKPVAVIVSTSPCYDNGWVDPATFRNQLFSAWQGVRPIGASLALLAPDRADADEPAGNTNKNYKTFTTGNTVSEVNLAPVHYEFGLPPSGVTDDDRWRYWYWSLIDGLAASTDYISYAYLWDIYQNAYGWELADRWLTNNTSAIVVLRGPEWPIYDYTPGSNYGAGGYNGLAEKYITIATPTVHPQACSVAVATAAATRNNVTPTPFVSACSGTVLPTPKATLQATPVYEPIYDATPPVTNMLQRIADRQARTLLAGQQMAVQINDTSWAYYNQTQGAKLLIQYLDIGVGCDELTWATSPGATILTSVCNGDTGLWKRREVTADPIYLYNQVATDKGAAVLKIRNTGADAHYLQMIQINVTPIATPTPTPFMTATAIPTPIRTATPTQTPTPLADQPRIVEIFASQGTPCLDLNARNGCNGGDEYVELYAPTTWSVADWTVAAGTCAYTLTDDTLIDGRLVIWADQMLNYEIGYPCTGFPTYGTVTLYDADAVVQDSYTYTAAAMAKAWALVGGSWQQTTPSPGR